MAISRANGGMFGNILLGGGIGAIIDHGSHFRHASQGVTMVALTSLALRSIELSCRQ